ncbi:thiamine phosphate synthase [Gemelliphila asaccharolytica]|uniref:Thiamine-phosphate synthase n=1 Tax=Gemelliphila asaccharolytica TaxID=502393 RepID=A0ABR5TLI8_9BACL|nr:thiamine phosphate synthase [Gemella asaccharolytica]KXB57716.1 thiamine-phosphate diphosphorylase [Gemella asaccharolytica]
MKKENLLLYAVTDRRWANKQSLKEQIELSLKGGVTFLQLREKNLSEEEFLKEAKEIKALAKEYKVPFIINDNVDVAMKVDADGVHVGQDDKDAKEVRKIIGKNKILGVSAQTIKQAIKAEKDGADYIGVGAVFPTGTKKDAENLSIEILKKICQSVTIPVVAIGGITKENILKLKGSKIAGVALVSAIFASKDIKQDCQKLKELSIKVVSK